MSKKVSQTNVKVLNQEAYQVFFGEMENGKQVFALFDCFLIKFCKDKNHQLDMNKIWFVLSIN
jgi:hypothetical protein